MHMNHPLMRGAAPGGDSRGGPPEAIRVLLVEDNPSDAHLVRSFLQQAERPRVTLVEAARLDEALLRLGEQRFDAILLDLFLPDARDLDALDPVRQAAPDTPIVVLTVHDEDELATRGVRAGVQDYLIKERLDPEALLRSLRYAIERQRLMAWMEHTSSLLRAALGATADGILVVDAEGRLASYNQQFARMWGIPQPLLSGDDDGALLAFVRDHLRDPDSFAERVRALYADPEAEGFDTIELRDGRTFERYTKPQRIGGEVVGRVWSFRDATERLRLQEQFLHSQKMEAVGQLAGGIAHQYNNLLTAITGNASLLLMDLPPEDPLREDVEEIERAANRAADLTRQLLAFGGRQALRPQVLDANALVARSEAMLRRVLPEDIRIETRLDAGAALVRVDPGQMEQVVLNLALNARDAMPRGGMLTLETRGARGDAVQIRVADTGRGMDEATRAHIFEPFYTTRGRAEASGLGLAAVHGIVQQSGGEIAVESAPGRGSTFTITLPSAGDAGRADRADAPATAPETVLLVEDEEMVRSVARRILERAGFRVLEAENGEAALRRAAAHEGSIDLLLSDIVMPGLSGPDLAERLLRLRPGTRVVYMSGYMEDALTRNGVPEGGAVFLHKPFQPEELLRLVRGRLERG
jgi:PAS domain S-box-containing protein